MQKQPNVLIISWHDTGRWFGCYGNEYVVTPNIDRLAGEGHRFTNYFSTSSVCSPSRASMLTGRYPQSNGVVGLCHPPNEYRLHEGERHLSAVLRDEGYSTHLFGFQHESPHHLADETLGFDERILADPVPPCTDVADAFARFVDNRGGDEAPFYAQVGFTETHTPFDFGGVTEDRTNGVYVPPYLKRTEASKQVCAMLQGAIKKADTAVGEMLAALTRNGLDDDTIVVFTIDHGVELPRAKWTLYDPGIEVPLIIRHPEGGITGGLAHDALLSHVDFFPTLLAYLGIPIPENVEGESFLPLLQGNAYTPSRDAVYSVFVDGLRAVRTERYKLVRVFTHTFGFDRELPIDIENRRMCPTFPFNRDGWPLVELYDLKNDPNEFTNLYRDPAYADVRKEMETRLWTWMEDVGDPLLEMPEPTPWYRSAIDDFRASAGTSKV